MNKSHFPAPDPDALITAIVDSGISLTPEIMTSLRASLDWLLFLGPGNWRSWQQSVISGRELRDTLFEDAQANIERFTGIKVPLVEARLELALFGERLVGNEPASVSGPPGPWDAELIARSAEKAKLAELETQDLIMGTVRGDLSFKDVAQELKKRPPSRVGAELVIDSYRRGEADAWLTALLLGACRDQTGYATVREILFLPEGAGKGYAGPALARINGPSALQDLINIMHNAPDRRSRIEAAYGLDVLGLSEAVPAIVDAVVSGRITRRTGVSILAETFPDEGVVLRLLDSQEKPRVELAAHIVAFCLENIPVPALVSRPSSLLLEALERALSDPDTTIWPNRRSCIRSWLDIRGSTRPP